MKNVLKLTWILAVTLLFSCNDDDNGTDANVPLRGVQAGAMRVREGFELVEGRMFEWGLNEVIVGATNSCFRAHRYRAEQVPWL